MHHGARYDVWMTDKAERLRQAREKVDDGIETTCKEYVVDERGDEWLVPRSTNPLHQSFRADLSQDGIERIEIIAIVVSSVRPE